VRQASEQAAAKPDQAEQTAADAKGTADEVQKKAEAAQAKAEAAASCVQSFLTAFSEVFSGATLKEGVEATVTELKALQPKCAPRWVRAGRVRDRSPPAGPRIVRAKPGISPRQYEADGRARAYVRPAFNGTRIQIARAPTGAPSANHDQSWRPSEIEPVG
jgi:hypothetical protein